MTRRAAETPDPARPPLDVRFEITVVGGEAGRRLATLQAQAILETLAWLSQNTTTPTAQDGTTPTSEEDGAPAPPP